MRNTFGRSEVTCAMFTACQGQSQDSNPGLSDSKATSQLPKELCQFVFYPGDLACQAHSWKAPMHVFREEQPDSRCHRPPRTKHIESKFNTAVLASTLPSSYGFKISQFMKSFLYQQKTQLLQFPTKHSHKHKQFLIKCLLTFKTHIAKSPSNRGLRAVINIHKNMRKLLPEHSVPVEFLLVLHCKILQMLKGRENLRWGQATGTDT